MHGTMTSRSSTPAIRRGGSAACDAREAVREVHAAIEVADPALIVLYCSPQFDRAELADEIHARFGDLPVIGCTTAGEISPVGYRRQSLAGFAISSSVASCAIGRLDGLSSFELADGAALTRALRASLGCGDETLSGAECFGFMLIDGLSTKEEHVVSAINDGMEGLPLVGGSAGDGESFGETFVYHEGAFRQDACVLTLVRTSLPFEAFRTQHFVPSDRKMVVTEADIANRVVTEINGAPAGREYARLVGLDVDELTPQIFATHPVVVEIGGEYYVRSIQKVNPDESLSFFCAIDEGIVLTVAKGVDLVDNLSGALEGVRSRLGPPELVLGFDCLLRFLEVDRNGAQDDVAKLFDAHNVVGFATYGEQFHGMHVNQTFTGVALGRRMAG